MVFPEITKALSGLECIWRPAVCEQCGRRLPGCGLLPAVSAISVDFGSCLDRHRKSICRLKPATGRMGPPPAIYLKGARDYRFPRRSMPVRMRSLSSVGLEASEVLLTRKPPPFVQVNRLDHVGVEALLGALCRLADCTIRQVATSDVVEPRMQQAATFQATHSRHADVLQDHVELVAAEPFPGGRSIAGCSDVVADQQGKIFVVSAESLLSSGDEDASLRGPRT